MFLSMNLFTNKMKSVFDLSGLSEFGGLDFHQNDGLNLGLALGE